MSDGRPTAITPGERIAGQFDQYLPAGMWVTLARLIDEELERVAVLVYAEGYSTPAPVAIAKVCDEVIDRSGALLGRVRDRTNRENP